MAREAMEVEKINKTTEKTRSSFSLSLRMLSFVKPAWAVCLVACSIVLFRALIEVVAVYFLSPAITAVTHAISLSRPGGFLQWLAANDPETSRFRSTLFWMAGSQFALGLAIYLRNVWDCKLSMRVVFHLRGAVYDKLQNICLLFHDKHTSGQLINRAVSDVQAVRMFVNSTFLTTIDIFASMAAYLGLLFYRSPWLMIASLLPVPFWCVAIRQFNRKAQPCFHSQQQAADELVGSFSESLSGIQVIRAFGAESREVEKFARLNEVLFSRILGVIHFQAKLTPMLKLIVTVAHIALFTLAAFLIQRGKLQIGDMMILGAAMGAILAKLQQIVAAAEVYQKAIVSGQRLFEILDAPSSTPQLVGAREPNFEFGEIEFENVSFGYGADTPALCGVSVKIPGGKMTAVVGPSGSGKTTLASLVARLYDPGHGVVRIDGQDLRQLDLYSLRRKVGYVFQETFLFSDTIRNNIAYGRSDVSDEMVRSAARAAHAEKFILNLPNGYDTRLGEKGVALSGGQRQRLAIARALVYDPEILVLDDATAALDPRTELAVYASIKPILKSRTVLMIAHNLKTIRAADHVLVMEAGCVVQRGKHEQLDETSGHYRDLVNAQAAPSAHFSFEGLAQA